MKIIKESSLLTLLNSNVFLIILFISTGCAKKGILEFGKNDFNGKTNIVYLPKNAPVNFQILQKTILDKKCSRCHNQDTEGGPAADADFTNYTAMMDSFPSGLIKGKPYKSRLYTSLLSGAKHRMPLKAAVLDDSEINYVKAFIILCAPEKDLEMLNSKDPCPSDDDDDFGDDDFKIIKN